MRILRCLICLPALLLLVACVSSPRPGAAPIALNDADAGKSVTLSLDQVLDVTLASNPTTGFSWKAAQIPAFLELVEIKEYAPDSGSAGRRGAGGTVGWIFRAATPGYGELKFVYQRPWETNGLSEKTIIYRVTSQTPGSGK